MGKSNNSPTRKLPKFPLWVHPNGQWCKKLGGKFYYFGAESEDPSGQQAAAKWYALAPQLRAGNGPPTPADELTLLELADRFLATKKAKVDAGKLSPRAWRDYKANCQKVLAFFGRAKRVIELRPDDFERLQSRAAKTCKPVTICSLAGQRHVGVLDFSTGAVWGARF